MVLFSWAKSLVSGREKPDHGAKVEVEPVCEHRSAAGPSETSVEAPEAGTECEECIAEKRAARKYTWKLVAGLMLPFAVTALDATIIASALPWIAAEFNEVSQLNWIISGFNLPSASFIPFWGQMTDIFGRMATLQISVATMLVSSAICTGAPTNNFPLLIFGRALQGVAAAGVAIAVRVILADKVSLKEYSKNWSIFSVTAGVSYGLGPVAGGYLTNISWRWCFAINLPICAAAMIFSWFFLRKELLGPQPIEGLDDHRSLEGSPNRENGHSRAKFAKRISTVDAGGQLLFLFGFGVLILSLTWAGATYDWNSPQVIVTLVVGTLVSCAWIYWEFMMAPGAYLNRLWPWQKSMLPWELLMNRDILLLFYINFATGFAMFAVLYYTDIYFVMVELFTSSQAGIQLLYYTPGLGVGVYLAIFLCNKWPRQTYFPLLAGCIIEAVGVGVLAWAFHHGHRPTIYGMMALTGAGTGLRFMPGGLHGLALFPQHIAAVTSLMAIAVPFGGTLGLTIMSTVFNNKSGFGRMGSQNMGSLIDLSKEAKDFVTSHARDGIVWAFIAITPFMVLAIVASLFLGNVRITSAANTAEGNRDHIVREPFFLYLLKRRRQQKPAGNDTENTAHQLQDKLSTGIETPKQVDRITPSEVKS